MKTVIKQQQQTTPEWKFPCLAKSNGGLIIYVTAMTVDTLTGMLINDDEPANKRYSSYWALSDFTPITTPLTITFIPD